MPDGVRRSRQTKALSPRARRIFHIMTAILFVGAIALVSYEIIVANQDAAQAAAFAVAPPCPPATVPVGNCAGWEQDTVSRAETGKGETSVQLSTEGQTFLFSRDTWTTNLTAGASVSVLVWRNQAQALREPTGEVLYSDDSAKLSRYDAISTVVWPLGAVALFYFCVDALEISPLRIRRPRLWTSVSVIGFSVGTGLFVAGLAIPTAQSVDTGITVGVIFALVVAGIGALWRHHRLRHPIASAR